MGIYYPSPYVNSNSWQNGSYCNGCNVWVTFPHVCPGASTFKYIPETAAAKRVRELEQKVKELEDELKHKARVQELEVQITQLEEELNGE